MMANNIFEIEKSQAQRLFIHQRFTYIKSVGLQAMKHLYYKPVRRK